MKIAIPTRNNKVEDHFGHCDTYTIVEVDDKKEIKSKEIFKWSQGCGCRSNVISTLKEMGVQTMLAGNMGHGALNKLLSNQVEVVRGCQGDIDQVIQDYLSGQITDKDILCQTHQKCHN
jgi:predicted Fe-Mo cluster-binding NifX family protein